VKWFLAAPILGLLFTWALKNRESNQPSDKTKDGQETTVTDEPSKPPNWFVSVRTQLDKLFGILP
jgi:hypothetical protein